MHTNTVRSAALLAAILAGSTALAEETARKPAAIDTITIIGDPAAVADIPGSAHVIDSEALAIFNDTDILRVLRAVPGVYLQEEEGFGLRPNIGIRGSGLDRSARIALLEDGVLIAPAPYSAPSAYYFPTQRRMSAVEVLKGPASVAVGPRTTGGALNLISTPIPTDFAVNADLRGGDHGGFDTLVNVGNRGNRGGWLVETVQSGSDGFKRIDGPVGGDTGFALQDYIVKLQLDSDPGADVYQSLRFKGGFTDQHADETYLGLTDEDFAADPNRRYAASANDEFDSEHEQYQLTYVLDPGDRWRGSLTAYRNNFERNWYKLQSVAGSSLAGVLADPATNATALDYLRGATSPDDAIQVRANNRRYYSQGLQGEIEWDLGFGDTQVALTTGFRLHEDEEDRFQWQDGYRMDAGELTLTSAGAPGSTTNRVSDADARSLFVTAEIRTGNWILTPGVRHEAIDLRRLDFSTTDPDRSDGPTQRRDTSVAVLIPGIGALYRVSPEWRLLAGVHKGFSPPAPGSAADEESSLNIEAGVRYDRGALSVEGIWFVNDYDNLVGTVTNSTGGGGEVGEQFDGGEVRVTGLELSAGFEASVGALRIPLSLQYTYTNDYAFKIGFESDFEPWGDVEPGDELPYIPAQQLRATAGIVTDQWRVNTGVSHVGRMRSTAGQGAYVPAESVESHVVWDFTAAWEFSESFSTYIKVDNVFDETYVASRRPAGVRPGLPRTAYLGLIYRL